ncbi:S-adenosyl-L-methionine-dependent methyltransferase, partial [Syncephalastrum racemosum]
LATEYPEWSCVGFDKTPTFPQTIRPSNTEFLSGNILNGLPFPDDTFDFVQMRAFIMVFTKENWTQALKEIHRVLKPGGWIQLLEPEWDLTPHTFLIVKNLMEESGVDPYVCERLPAMLTETNFNVMQEERRSVRLKSIEACRPFLNGLYNFQSEQDFEFWKAQYTKAQKDTSEAVWYAAAAQKPL